MLETAWESRWLPDYKNKNWIVIGLIKKIITKKKQFTLKNKYCIIAKHLIDAMTVQPVNKNVPWKLHIEILDSMILYQRIDIEKINDLTDHYITLYIVEW